MNLWPTRLVMISVVCLLAAIAAADAPGSLPDELELTPDSILGAVKPQARAYFTWQRFVEGEITGNLSAGRTQGAVANAKDWLRTLLRPEWVPEHLDTFIRCSEKAVLGLGPTPQDDPTNYDAVGIRYSIDGSAIQVIQTSYLMGVVIAPSAVSRGANLNTSDLQFPRYVARTAIREADHIIRVSMQRCRSVDGVLRGKAELTPTDFVENQWYDSVFWFTDGKVFAFTCRKVRGGPADAPRTPDWF